MNRHRYSQTPDAGLWQPCVGLMTPAVLKPWLRESASLTRRVQSVCAPDAPFGLRVLRHDFAPPHRDERAILHKQESVRTREVLLMRGMVPLVFAHSVVARADLRGAWASMDGIGAKSLGSVLFADHAVWRGSLHYRCLDARHPLFQKALRWCGDFAPHTLWARRALFVRQGRPLLVSEVFLPAVLTL